MLSCIFAFVECGPKKVFSYELESNLSKIRDSFAGT